MVINNVKTTWINQMTTNFQIGIFISVAKIQGTSAEKKIIAETLVIATTNFTSKAALATSNEGKNISIIEMAEAFAKRA